MTKPRAKDFPTLMCYTAALEIYVKHLEDFIHGLEKKGIIKLTGEKDFE